MIGKKYSSDDDVLGRFRRLQKLVNSLQAGSTAVAGTKEDFVELDKVEWKTDDYAVLATDFGSMLIMNSGASKTFTLPAVIAADVRLAVTFAKCGAGKVTIQAGGADKIQDSGAGGTLYNDLAEETFAVVKLKVIAAGMWIIENFTGSGWRTS
jgi:hypothetical protein